MEFQQFTHSETTTAVPDSWQCRLARYDVGLCRSNAQPPDIVARGEFTRAVKSMEVCLCAALQSRCQ